MLLQHIDGKNHLSNAIHIKITEYHSPLHIYRIVYNFRELRLNITRWQFTEIQSWTYDSPTLQDKPVNSRSIYFYNVLDFSSDKSSKMMQIS